MLTASFISHSTFALGWKRTLIFLIVGFTIPYLSEAIGLRFGLPFGQYSYTGYLGTVLPFGVPTYVMLSWLLLLYSGIFVSTALAIVFPQIQGNWEKILFVSLLMVAVDGIIDPVAVKVGHWKWIKPGKWYGVSFQNYFGWFLTSLVTLTVLMSLTDPLESSIVLEPRWLYFLPVLMFGLLHLHFIGLLRKIELSSLVPLALVLATGMTTLYFIVLSDGMGKY